MKSKLSRNVVHLHHFLNMEMVEGPNPHLSGDCSDLSGNCSGLSGNCSGLSGNCSGLSGNCSGLSGNLDECEITPEDRRKEVFISTLAS